MKLGEKIRVHRKELHMTQTELGEKLGVKVNAVSKWECGRVEDIPTSKIKALAKIFDVPVSYLIDNDSDDKPQPADPKTDGLREKLVEMLMSLTPDETRQVIAFVKGLTASRKDPPAPEE